MSSLGEKLDWIHTIKYMDRFMKKLNNTIICISGSLFRHELLVMCGLANGKKNKTFSQRTSFSGSERARNGSLGTVSDTA